MLKHPYEPRPLTVYGGKKIDAVLAKHPCCLVYVKAGGGKTFMSIEAAAKAMPNAHLLIFTTKKQKVNRNFEDSIDSYNQVMSTHLTYYVSTYDHLQLHDKFVQIQADLAKQKPNSTIMILDEGHKVKNPTSIRSKNMFKLQRMPQVIRSIFLTATPISNSILDAETYLIAAGMYRNKTQFERQHVIMRDQYHQPIVRDWRGNIDPHLIKNYNQVIQQLESISVIIDTQKLLPKTVRITKKFKFDRTTQKEYRKIRKALINGEIENSQQALKQQRDFVATHSLERLQFVKEKILSPKRPNGTVLIFYQYQTELEVLKQYLIDILPKDYLIKEINGHAKAFDTSKPPKNSHSVFLIQYQAGGEGMNMAYSSFTIFFAPPVSYEKFEQAMGRNVRAFQKGPVYQIRLQVDKTINQHYWEDLIDKKQKFSKHLQYRMAHEDD